MDLRKPQFGAASSSSSSSSSTHSFKHDVFLSFRGPDTRNNFTGHLYNSLVQNRINTFIDNDLMRGEDITEELLQVIEGSRISIVVFSAHYAHSKCCLDELVKILQCKKANQQMVYPIFSKIDASKIRYLNGPFAEGIAHLSQYKDNWEKVESWKAALMQAADMFGWPISDERESYFNNESYDIIWMHDLIEDMGKEIVRQESPNEPGQRSRLWRYEDVCKVLGNNKGTDKIKGITIILDLEDQPKLRLNSGSFRNMENLQILKVPYLGIPNGELHLDYLPDELRVIIWTDPYSLRSLPTNFNPRKLGMLHMAGPCMIPLVNQRFKNMPHLKSIKLGNCRGLARIPDLSGLTSLSVGRLGWKSHRPQILVPVFLP